MLVRLHLVGMLCVSMLEVDWIGDVVLVQGAVKEVGSALLACMILPMVEVDWIGDVVLVQGAVKEVVSALLAYMIVHVC